MEGQVKNESHLCGFAQIAFLEEISAVAGRIVIQTPENLVSEFLVTRKRLEIERVTMGVRATALAGFLFRGQHEAAAESVPATSLRDPKRFDKQPIPVRAAQQAADDLPFFARHHV